MCGQTGELIGWKKNKLNIVDTYYLIDPTDKGRDFNVDAWNLSSTAAETPANQTT